MTVFLYANRAQSQLARAVASDETSLLLVASGGNAFPSPGVGQAAQLTLIGVDGSHEIVTMTARIGDTLTVIRAQEGTPAAPFAINSAVELRLTAAVISTYLQTGGGKLTGDLDLDNHNIRHAVFPDGTAINRIFTPAVFPQDGNSTCAIFLPNGAGRPIYNNSTIVNIELLLGLVFAYYGNLNSLPLHLKLCNGTNGTPDLRSRFILGAGGVNPENQIGGDFSVQLNPAGAHGHTGSVLGTALTVAQLPPVFFANATQLDPSGNIPADGTAFKGAFNTPGFTGGGQAHGHGLAIDPAGDHIHTGISVPAFYALGYVMFRSLIF